jgi:FkbM family methyltransferase
MIFQKLNSVLVTAQARGIAVMARAVLRLTVSHFKKSVLGQRFQTLAIHDYQMTLDTADAGLSRALILFGTREMDHKVMLERIVKPSMMIFDIGGNIGYYPLMELSLLGGTGKMVIVEPSPSNVELLQKNLQLNGYNDVPVLQAAVSDKAGEREFFLSEQSNLGTFHPVGSGSETLTGETVDVETVTVPMLAKKFGAPDLIRMDVEGHEVEVLNGMVSDVRAGKYAPMVIFETHLTRYGEEHDMASALRALFNLGYSVSLAASSSDQGTERLVSLGYEPGMRIATDGIYRTLFSNISDKDAIGIITQTGGARTVLLTKTP